MESLSYVVSIRQKHITSVPVSCVYCFPTHTATEGNAWKLPKWNLGHWEIPSIHRRNFDGCNESSPVTAMICSIKIIHIPNNPPISKVHSFVTFSVGGWPLSSLNFAQSDLLFYLISRLKTSCTTRGWEWHYNSYLRNTDINTPFFFHIFIDWSWKIKLNLKWALWRTLLWKKPFFQFKLI